MASPYNVTTVIDHSSNATFRAWGLEFSTALSTIGLVQTADTGQINWATVNYNATTNTVAGYEIWRFADSTIYMKFEYGTSGSATAPEIWITCGTGSNGTGTITGGGAISTRSRVSQQNVAPFSTVTAYTSYFSRTADHFSICWKQLGSGGAAPMGAVVVGKSVDSSGAATTTGFGVFRPCTPGFQSVRMIATAAAFSDLTQNYTCVPGQPATSLDDSGNYQAYMINMNLPKVLPFLWANIVLVADLPRGVTFTVAQVGASARTFLSLGAFSTSVANSLTAALVGVGMLYE